MKKIISFLGLFIALVLHVHASPVSVSKALQVAQRFFATTSPSNQGELKVQFTAKGTPTEPNKTQKNTNGINTQSLKTASTHTLYYVINRGESNGYVVVSGDDRVQPVLAYADKGGLTEDEIEHHPSIKWMFDEYKNQIQWAITIWKTSKMQVFDVFLHRQELRIIKLKYSLCLPLTTIEQPVCLTLYSGVRAGRSTFTLQTTCMETPLIQQLRAV